MNGMEVLEIKNEVHKGGNSMNDLIKDEYKYTKEDICSICNVDEKTFRRFFEEVRLDIGVQSGITTLAHNKKMYTEQVLQKFQAWLMKNEEIKPTNVGEAVAAGWKTAEEMYTIANSSKSTWDRFIVDVKNAMSKKPNSRCFTDDTANLVVFFLFIKLP